MKLIDAEGIHYRQLNEIIREEAGREKEVRVINVRGQRYIAAGLEEEMNIVLEGIPGNDLGVFMGGPTVEVKGNTQDGTGNTMNQGKIIIHGHSGDVMAYAMRGGEIYVKTNVGYRTGIHMKECEGRVPCLVVGGRAGNFLGEYQAGGIIVLLGLDTSPEDLVGDFCGTGMHGGVIYLRKGVPSYRFAKEVNKSTLEEEDIKILKEKINNYVKYFQEDEEKIDINDFMKISPAGSRPYGNLYAY